MSDLEARIALEVGRVITNASNFPQEMRVHMWGRDLSEPIDKITEALAPVIREAQAEARAEGRSACDREWSEITSGVSAHDMGSAHETPNPYRSNA